MYQRYNDQTIEQLHTDFLISLQTQNYSPKTITSYRSDFRTFLQFLSSQGVEYIEQVDSMMVRRYAAYLGKNHSPATVTRRLNSVRSFFKWAFEEELVTDNPTKKLRTPRIPKKLPVYLTLDEMTRLLNVPALNHPMDKAIMYTFLNTGLRRGEVVNLNLDDIDLSNNTLLVRNGKGQKDRMVPINKMLKTALLDYLSVRPNVNDHGLFIGMRTARRRISKIYLHELLKKCLEQSSITKHVTLHKLRHTFATNLLNAGVDLRTLQELLGHSDLTTTQIYVHVSKKRLADAVNKLDNLSELVDDSTVDN